ncbi:MAG: hypothetical protein EOP84_27800 [Verrucomicrobiaceae bacterium]|nr:MAG: hypothetical protein EOP84_27800 [Verrucomicrobiaceae bacterium]
MSRARSLDIDGFSLLMRVSRFPAQPKQLNTGIRSWLQAYGQPWPLQSKTLPLNLVLTFCAKLVNDVRQSGIRHGLAASFGQLQQLGSLTDPKAVTTFATTYSQFDEGRLQGDSAEQARAVKEIMSDAAFQTRFAENAQSFEEMARDGGTDYFFRHLKAQAQASRRPLLVAHRLQESQEQLLQLIREHLPSDSAPIEERRRILDTWRDAMLALLQTPSSDPQQPDTAAKLSRHLRRFLNIDPADLDDIPQKAIQTRVPIRAYLEKQFRDWKARQTSQGTFSEVGFLDATHAQKALGYLLEATDLAEVEEYFRADLGHIPSRSEARNARRFLAVKMSRELLNGRLNGSAHFFC